MHFKLRVEQMHRRAVVMHSVRGTGPNLNTGVSVNNMVNLAFAGFSWGGVVGVKSQGHRSADDVFAVCKLFMLKMFLLWDSFLLHMLMFT